MVPANICHTKKLFKKYVFNEVDIHMCNKRIVLSFSNSYYNRNSFATFKTGFKNILMLFIRINSTLLHIFCENACCKVKFKITSRKKILTSDFRKKQFVGAHPRNFIILICNSPIERKTN